MSETPDTGTGTGQRNGDMVQHHDGSWSCWLNGRWHRMETVRSVAEREAGAYRRGLLRAAELAETEPELPGPVPAELSGYPVADVARIAVQLTKQNIVKRIRSEAGE